jgi:hypothetical protein
MTDSTELTIVDGFDADAADPSGSPIRGNNWRFIDGEYFAFKEPIDVGDDSFVVLDILKGWQKLEKGCPPEYLMQLKGEPKPPQPHVDKADWPPGLPGQEAKHPWKWTQYMWLLNTKTGEISTFWTNTTGGPIAIKDLSDQVVFMRQMRPDAMPVVALESTIMPNEFRTPRPRFRILGWRQRSDAGGASAALTGPEQSSAPQQQLDTFAAEQPADPPAEKAAEPATTKKAGTGKATKRGVTRIDVPTKTVEPPSSEEILNDKIDF